MLTDFKIEDSTIYQIGFERGYKIGLEKARLQYYANRMLEKWIEKSLVMEIIGNVEKELLKSLNHEKVN